MYSAKGLRYICVVGARVTTEINCRTDDYEHPSDPVFTRNHAPNRVVLGIIAKDGVLAQCAAANCRPQPQCSIHRRMQCLRAQVQYRHIALRISYVTSGRHIGWRYDGRVSSACCTCHDQTPCSNPSLEHARYATVPVENLHRVPDNITDQEACFTEPLAAACRIVEQKVACAHLTLQLTEFIAA